MVKIVVRRSEDIIRAYLKGMGFDDKCDLSALLTAYPQLKDDNNSGHGVIDTLDTLIAKAARKVFSDTSSADQLIALYKVAYWELDGAKKWGLTPLSADYQNPQYTAAMQAREFSCAPAYCFSEMPVQVIESYKPSLFHKIFRKKNND